MIQSWPCTQKTLLGNCNLLFSYNFEQIKLSQTGWNIWHTPLDRGGPVENVESLWFLDSSAPLSPPNATSSLLLPVLFKEHTALISFSAGGSKSWNFHTTRLVSSLLPSNKVAWKKKLQCYYGGFRKELPPAAAAAIQGTRRWPNIYLRTVGGSESESLLPEQKLFPATPAMEQWLEDLDTRVVGWEMLTGWIGNCGDGQGPRT